MHLPGHEGHKFGEVDRVVSISIDLSVSDVTVSTGIARFRRYKPKIAQRSRSMSEMGQVCVCAVVVARSRVAAGPHTHLVDHVLELGLGWVLAQRAHDGTELFGGDCSISICT